MKTPVVINTVVLQRRLRKRFARMIELEYTLEDMCVILHYYMARGGKITKAAGLEILHEQLEESWTEEDLYRARHFMRDYKDESGNMLADAIDIKMKERFG